MIPIIDFSPLQSVSPTRDDWQMVAKDIYKELSKFGFMYVINHGINVEKVKTVFDQCESFFKQPAQIKDKYEIDITKDYVGYTKAGKEILNNTVYELRETISTDNPEILMEIPEIPKLMPAMETLRKDCQPMLHKLYKLLGLALELDDVDYFVEIHNEGNLHQTKHSTNRSMVKVNYYPALTGDVLKVENTTRLSAHTDYGSVTLLFQDNIGGLEVKSDGTWRPIEPLAGAVLVNIGDAIDIMTRGTFPANLHRVVIPTAEIERRCSRMSLAYFVWPDQNTLLKPLESRLIRKLPGNVLEQVPVLFREHGERRMNEGYTVPADQ